MCKILFAIAEELKKLEQSDLENIIGELREPDGDGVALKFPDKIEILKTHKKWENKVWAELIFRVRNSAEWILYHSRSASQGLKNDFYCQPFYVHRDNAILAHNGDYDFTPLEQEYLTKLGIRIREGDSDSYVISKIVAQRGKNILKCFYQGNNTFIYGDSGRVWLYGKRLWRVLYKDAYFYITPYSIIRANSAHGFSTSGIAILYPQLKIVAGQWEKQFGRYEHRVIYPTPYVTPYEEIYTDTWGKIKKWEE